MNEALTSRQRVAFPKMALAAVAVLASSPARAATIAVSTSIELSAAIAGAKPGDTIVLASGTYALAGVTCATNATAVTPIVVRAATPLAAVIELSGVEGFKVTGAHWHFEGLDVRGVCPNDSDCEHAFHVVGQASGFTLRDSRVRDFNAQLKVNAEKVGGAMKAPDDGLVERCELFDSAGRKTSNPVTKLNIDGGARWVVRDNYLHDFAKDGGNFISYGAFMKSGGSDGLFERNLVVCSTEGATADTRIGLSFGGGGTAPEYCAPAYDAGVPCDPEHTNGTMRNNVIAACSDVGIYLNRSAGTELLFNSLIGTSGIDFRFASTSGVAHGNVLAGAIKNRDGATHSEGPNLAGVSQALFDAWYIAPLAGDLRLKGDVSALLGQATPHAHVKDDYCARVRPAASPSLGALEHSLGDCATDPGGGGMGGGGMGGGGMGGGGMGGGGGAGVGGAGGGMGGVGGIGGGPGAGAAGGGGMSGGLGAAGSTSTTTSDDTPRPAGGGGADTDAGCGCHTPGDVPREGAWRLVAFAALGLAARRRR